MIEGFRIEVTGEELLRHLQARVAHHEHEAAECDRRRARFEAGDTLDPEDDDAELGAVWPAYGFEAERQAAHHRRRVAALTFLQDHVIAHEIYRLSHGDFKLLEIGPDALRVAHAN